MADKYEHLENVSCYSNHIWNYLDARKLRN